MIAGQSERIPLLEKRTPGTSFGSKRCEPDHFLRLSSINTPGTPQSAATVLDGFPMAQQGKADFALGWVVRQGHADHLSEDSADGKTVVT